MRLTLTALLCAIPVMAQAQEAPVHLTCALTILCPDTGACRDWDQRITIVEGAEGWSVTWNADLPSDYELIADIAPADDAVEPLRVRSLLYRNTRTQATQMVTFDSAGGVVVTGHQPHAATRVVSGLGRCTATE